MTTITAAHAPATADEERDSVDSTQGPVELSVAFVDLEGFTTYTEAAGDSAASRLLNAHHRGSQPIVRSRGGRLLKQLGDGLMLIFPTPEAAVLACLELGEISPLPQRAGIHCGNVLVTCNDVVGHAVNLAARVTESAKGGQLVITEHVRIAAGELRGVTFDGPHVRHFRGIGKPASVYFVSSSADVVAS